VDARAKNRSGDGNHKGSVHRLQNILAIVQLPAREQGDVAIRSRGALDEANASPLAKRVPFRKGARNSVAFGGIGVSAEWRTGDFDCESAKTCDCKAPVPAAIVR
jgi:hypothetical protein